MVDSTPSTLVRLDTYADPLKAAWVKNDHPAEWTDAGLIEVLERVMIAGGEDGAAPEKVLSYAEISQMAPGLREAFHRAKPSEWVVFSSVQSKATFSRFTSGGLFIRDGKLHVMIANHRVRIPAGKTDVIDPNRAAPLRPVAGINRTLSFDPPQFVSTAQGGWVEVDADADVDRPLSKLAVDHAAFLASLPPEQPLAPVVQAKPAPPAAEARGAGREARDSSSNLEPRTSNLPPAAAEAPSPVPEMRPEAPEAKVKRLEDEIERARLNLDRQTEELARLRSRLGKAEGEGHN